MTCHRRAENHQKTEKSQCPYCERQATSPGGLRFHIKLEHPEKFDEFNQKHYPEMAERFKQSIAFVWWPQ